jgi:hypothetical protein
MKRYCSGIYCQVVIFNNEYLEHKRAPRARATLNTSTTEGGSGRAVWMQPGLTEGGKG